jgi:hypothetical protein
MRLRLAATRCRPRSFEATTLKEAAAQRRAKKAKAMPAKQAKPTKAELDVSRRKGIADRKI